MSNYNDGTQPPSGEPPRRPDWPPGTPWQNPPNQAGAPWQGQRPDQQGTPWQSRQPDQPANPWQTPPEPRRPYVPDIPPSSSGANDWAYEHPQAPSGEDTSVMSVKDWLKCFLLMLIPCASIILPFIWAFSSTGNVNRRNLFRAMLIMMAIVFAIYIFIAIITVVIGFSLSMPYL